MNFEEVSLFIKYLAPYKIKIAVIVALTIVCSLFDAVNIGMLVPLLQMMEGQTNPGGTLWDILNTLFDFVHLEVTFINLLLALVIVFLFGQLLIFIRERMQVRVFLLFASDLRKKIFDEIVSTDMPFHYEEKTGNLINIIAHETSRSSQALYAITKLFSSISLILVYSIMLFYLSTAITIIVIFIAALCFVFFNIYISKSKKIGQVLVEIDSFFNIFLNERLGMVKLIKIISNEKKESQEFSALSDRAFNASFDFTMIGKKVEIIFQVILFIIAVSVLLLSATVFYIQLPLLIIFLFILVRLTEPLRSLNAIRHELTAEIPSLRKIDQIIIKAKNAQHIKNGNIPFQSINSTLDFDNVNFSYRENCPVLKNINFAISKNEMVAFVGMSGGGKSTIIDMLLRIIEPTNGKILINGIELSQYEIRSFHEKIGVVSQDTFIFNDSVLNNICYGADKIDRGLAVESAKIANAHEFIIALPHGYETTLGDRGVQISGGEKQRIAIARAIYRNPEILVFDEATSALDSKSEKAIQVAINNLRFKYTMIMVAHRLSTVKDADRLFVIEKGEIVEQGTHEQLLDKNARYASYYQMQQGSSP